ncbi:dihydroneopterin triphosphate diphosphatase [Parvibium lacunae]|uniref:Dihydroneopterin triphosphate diphosphatase n=1 Tax=Parvibium lacunae TaxID=1888893 RepID=A0A368L0F4_9BURK|nr:dihydroneopterin triphosphate diphosphatase [Parvibium lacunae]RCS56549.1 dihydroneopterin triphosphate diphosphatase [Parvibium lacunae]
MPYKIPHSVLVVIHSPDLQVLLLERADHPGYWQSVTGSLDHEEESLVLAACREVQEETGLVCDPMRLLDWQQTNEYEIFAHWRHRYAPGVTHNTEHVFSVCVARDAAIQLAPREHLQYQWLPWQDAAERCFSWSNAQAIQRLPQRVNP